jgi:hypothetical protein
MANNVMICQVIYRHYYLVFYLSMRFSFYSLAKH